MRLKYSLFIIASIISANCVLGNINADSTELKFKQEIKSDTLVLKVLQDTSIKADFQLEKSMPWIAAIVVGLLTILANILINRQLRKLNRESLDKQLANLKETTERQISNSKDIALAQIENSRKNVQLEFNKTVLSGNRQSWINDLRDTISKLLSKSFSIGLQANISQEELKELKFLISKTELMLNADKDKQYINSLKELEKCLIDIVTGKKEFMALPKYIDDVKLETQKTLKTEWERVKRGE